MRRLSTRIGVYAIFLITAFYGTLSITIPQGKTALNAAEIDQTAATPTVIKEETDNESYYLSKNDNGKAVHSVSLNPTPVTRATAITEAGFFTHSATIRHHISNI